jgi:thiol-disulfide isomerase/thioredoxin
MMKKFLALILLSVLMACAPLLQARGAQPVREGDEEVSLKLKGLDGRSYDIKGMRGNVVLVSFGATWCQPCVAELRALEELKKEYSAKPVKILWINIEGDDEISDQGLREYVKKQKLTLPVLRDTAKLTYAQFSTRVRIPLVVFFDKNGNVVKPVRFGMATPEMYKTMVRERLDKLLATQDAGKSARVESRFVER